MPLNKKDIAQIKEIVHDGENRLVEIFHAELGSTEKRLEKFVHETVHEVVHEVVHHEIENLARITAEGFKAVDERFEQVDKRFEQIDQRFEQIDQRFEQVDQRFGRVDASLMNLEAKLDNARHDIAVIKENFVYRGELKTVVERLVVVERKVAVRK